MAERKMADSTGAESSLTMCDVLEEERELEEDAKAVLGDSDDTNCTYNFGYVPRQALYACATCKTSGEPGGICLACSYACHENHELVELYTKRNFRCDCGNKKFTNNPCRLCPKKVDSNSQNSYNQNFEGLYCSCSRPYPDVTDNIVDEMIQCVICEDWFHGRHLTNRVPDNEDYGEMICKKCISHHEFLSEYKAHFESEKNINIDVVSTEHCDSIDNTKVKVEAENNEVKVESVKEEIKFEPENEVKIDPEIKIKIEAANEKINVATEANVKCEEQDSANALAKGKTCFLQTLKSKVKMEISTAFLPEGWRKDLCRCVDCIELYEKENCSFLIDEHDTIKAYEDRGKKRNGGEETQYDKGLSALGQLDRVKQIEAIHEYNNMKVQLKDYLKTFADAKRTVSAKDIEDFFEGMRQQKRRRVETSVPHFCR